MNSLKEKMTILEHMNKKLIAEIIATNIKESRKLICNAAYGISCNTSICCFICKRLIDESCDGCIQIKSFGRESPNECRNLEEDVP